MKKIFLLLSSGFFLTTFSVMGQEQQEENNNPVKLEVSNSEEANSNKREPKKVKSSEKVRLKKELVNKKAPVPKPVRREAETVREEKTED